MKRIVLFMAAAAMLFSSCQKEVEETPAGTPGGEFLKHHSSSPRLKSTSAMISTTAGRLAI